MQIRNASNDQIYQAIAKTAEMYDGNVTDKDGVSYVSKNVRRVCLRAKDSRGPGARWSAGTGRRGPWSCWHVFRDFCRALLEIAPNASIRTSLAHYTAENFESAYRETAYKNVGSMMYPRHMPELCECGWGG